MLLFAESKDKNKKQTASAMPEANPVYPDIETLCRLCLTKHPDAEEDKHTYTIFAEDDTLHLSLKFIQCIGISAKPSDDLPKKICGECRYQLEKSFLFRQRSQASDKKLRKHLRLLSLGKKSRVFAQDQDDYDDDDELECEDSLAFIQEQDKKREMVDENWREKFKEAQQEELMKRLNEARVELRAEVRKEVRQELAEEVRNELNEVNRMEQMAKLLGELEIFLVEKKAGLWQPLDELDETKKARAGLKRKLKGEAEEAPIEANEEFRDIQMVGAGEMDKAEDGEIYIINSNSGEEAEPKTSSVELQPEPSITSYNIKDNGEIQFSGDKSSEIGDVVVFDLDEDLCEEEEQQQSYDFEQNVIVVPKEGPTPAKRKVSNDFIKQTPAEAPSIRTGRLTDTVKTFQCDMCPAVFATFKLLNRHLNTHVKTLKNGKGGTFACSVCGLQLSCASSLKRHMVIHSGLKPYKCDQCSLSFSQREVLKRHMDRHTGAKRHQCPHCSSCFAQKSNLQQHISRVHLESTRSHKCHLCDRCFNHVSGLSRHLATHAGVSFACKECGRKFNDRSAMQRHVQVVHKRSVDSISDSELEFQTI